MDVIRRVPIVSRPAASRSEHAEPARIVDVHLEGFALEAIEEEAAHLGVSVEELATFCVLYYLADVDSGRIARRPPDATHHIA